MRVCPVRLVGVAVTQLAMLPVHAQFRRGESTSRVRVSFSAVQSDPLPTPRSRKPPTPRETIVLSAGRLSSHAISVHWLLVDDLNEPV